MRGLLIKNRTIEVIPDVRPGQLRTLIEGPYECLFYLHTSHGVVEGYAHTDWMILGQDDPEAWNVLVGMPMLRDDTPVAGNVVIVGIQTSGFRSLADGEIGCFRIGTSGGAVITMSRTRRSLAIPRLDYNGDVQLK